MTATPARTHRTTLSSTLVRIVCVTLTSVSLGCALLGLGLTCSFLGQLDHVSAPCPNRLTVGVFGAAGALLALSLFLLIIVCRGRRRLSKEVLLEDLPECGGGDEGGKREAAAPLELSSEAVPQAEPLSNGGEDNYDLTQKSADVSYWIEQQKTEAPSTSNSFPLDHRDVATHRTSDNEEEGEMTAL